MLTTGRPFYKMSGSGNDFLFFDARDQPPGELEQPGVVRAVCARGTGVGADGIVFLSSSDVATLRMRYLNSDGSRAEMCGNAALCATRLAVELGWGSPAGLSIESDSGVLAARYRDGLPEVDLGAVGEVQPRVETPLAAGERAAGFAIAGVPHLVIRCEDVGSVDVVGRGRPLRRLPQFQHGANVNFVSPDSAVGMWRMRTYERGVEAETLACGTGAIATAILLSAWGAAAGDVRLITRSGRTLRVRLRPAGDGVQPSLSGEGRLVFTGILGEIPTSNQGTA
ncbi:MAG TPA: diaminopimelate epimerase [Gemmatimonadaceae bacterium]|nr:diaminopimelate epimerase [Gemmatimonadaceae bacterium]